MSETPAPPPSGPERKSRLAEQWEWLKQLWNFKKSDKKVEGGVDGTSLRPSGSQLESGTGINRRETLPTGKSGGSQQPEDPFKDTA